MFRNKRSNFLADQTFDSAEAMRRLFWLMLGGCGVILAYGASESSRYISVACLGVITAAAAALLACFVGFIFGVPYSRRGVRAQKVHLEKGESATHSAQHPTLEYRPNTSLEQISDWLSKMLVGVGLAEIKDIPDRLWALAGEIGKGLGNGASAQGFALGIILFFSICGFLFGFIWARIYLRRWFIDADSDAAKKLGRYEADGRALGLVQYQLERRPEEPPENDRRLQEAVEFASVKTRRLMFLLARAASADTEVSDYSIRNTGAESVFKALIAADPDRQYHRNHGELSYVLSRRAPRDLPGAIAAITEAIKRRDALQVSGWRYYELRRARYHIQLDLNFKKKARSEEGRAREILDDLAAAREDTERWARWLSENPDVVKWIEINGAQARLDEFESRACVEGHSEG